MDLSGFSGEILKTMMLAAVSAGELIKVIAQNNDYEVQSKSDMSPVTRADVESAGIIERILRGKYPEFDILCEETEDILAEDGTPRRLTGEGCFIVDPLDGTRGFIEGSEDFAVSVAFCRSHRVISGVVYAPVGGRLYYALEKGGARKAENINGDNVLELLEGKIPVKMIKVSKRKNDLIYVAGLHGDDAMEADIVRKNSDKIKEIIKVGSCIKGCLIAEGKADVHYRFAGYTKEWDSAGMQIICSEAGAVFTDAYGNPLYANRPDVVNRNGIRILNRMESEFRIDN